METLIFANSKGGVGKTHLSYHVAKNLSEAGNMVLCLDLCEQSQLVTFLQLPAMVTLQSSIVGGTPIEDTIFKVTDTLHCVYSDMSLRMLEGYLMGFQTGGYKLIYKKLKPVLDKYDYVVVDMPPATTLTSTSSYAFPNPRVVIPVLPDFLSLDSMKQLLITLEDVREDVNSDVRVSGIILCQDNTAKGKHAKECMELLRSDYADDLCPVTFRDSEYYKNSALEGQSIKEHLKEKRVKDVHNLGSNIDEIINYILRP